jgi:hypothetical protein
MVLNFATAKIVIFTLGFVNVLMMLLIFFSCRCLAGPKIFNWLFKYNWFKKFYKVHCYLWWIFFVSVLVHAVLAIWMYGLP